MSEYTTIKFFNGNLNRVEAVADYFGISKSMCVELFMKYGRDQIVTLSLSRDKEKSIKTISSMVEKIEKSCRKNWNGMHDMKKLKERLKK